MKVNRARAAYQRVVEQKTARAFNLGSDARIRGEPMLAPVAMEVGMRHFWRQGWSSAHREWGLDAKWEIKKLVPLENGRIA